MNKLAVISLNQAREKMRELMVFFEPIRSIGYRAVSNAWQGSELAQTRNRFGR